jgi:hypothetical protein
MNTYFQSVHEPSTWKITIAKPTLKILSRIFFQHDLTSFLFSPHTDTLDHSGASEPLHGDSQIVSILEVQANDTSKNILKSDTEKVIKKFYIHTFLQENESTGDAQNRSLHLTWNKEKGNSFILSGHFSRDNYAIMKLWTCVCITREQRRRRYKQIRD